MATNRISARATLLLLGALSGAYGLLAYIPFTYQAVIKFPMVSWIPAFVRIHPLLWLGVAGWNAWSDRERMRGWSARIFHAVSLAFAVAMLIHPPLRAIRNDGSSLVLACAFFLLPLWALVLDAARAPRLRTWTPGPADETRRLTLAACAAALFCALFFPGAALFRPGPALPGEVALMVWGWTLGAELLLFLAGAALLMGIAGLGRLFRPWAELLLVGGALWLGLARFLYAIVFRPMAFQGLAASAVAGLLGALGLAFLLAMALECPEGREESVLDLALRPLVLLLGRHPWRAAAWFLAVGLGSWLLLARAAVFDWNFLFQKTIVVGTGALVFAGAFAALPVGKARNRWVWALLLGPILAMNLFLAFDEGLMTRRNRRQDGVRPGQELELQAGRDVSVMLLRELLAPVKVAQRSIYRVLQLNSNISREVRTDPVDIQHVAVLEPGKGPRPDIFIFVVDSLRRDYLGAYNPAVKFTPELDKFALEANVMRNAFTRYGATGLSEPSIWTGSLMLHKQYITPFYPMNSLQKLLETDGYHGLVSVDSILEVVVKPGPWLKNLDPGVGTQDLRLGASLDKVQAALDGGQRSPLFVYSQAQDIHISVINREGGGEPVPGDYKGFYAPYASRLHRLDADFGRFIRYLKAKGRFDDSIIIFTADHGDSLGEEGRFGHAYTLFPEIIRIPMLIHLPPALGRTVSADLDAPAFSTDLTPSLYYLLGHRPLKADPALGRPLFTETPAEQTPYHQDHYLLASSYGAVFGILDGSGKSLYISDGVNFADHFYRLDQGGTTGLKRPLSPEQKMRNDQQILDDLDMLNQFYHFKPGP